MLICMDDKCFIYHNLFHLNTEHIKHGHASPHNTQLKSTEHLLGVSFSSHSLERAVRHQTLGMNTAFGRCVPVITHDRGTCSFSHQHASVLLSFERCNQVASWEVKDSQFLWMCHARDWKIRFDLLYVSSLNEGPQHCEGLIFTDCKALTGKGVDLGLY